MNKNWRSYAAVCLAGGLALTQLAGCGNKTAEEQKAAAATEKGLNERQNENPGKSADPSLAEDRAAKAADGTAEGADGSITVTAQLAQGETRTVQYLAEDLETEWDRETATGIVMEASGILVEGDGARADGTTVTIGKAGTYVVSGEMEDGQIRIEADDDAVVRLVLNGIRLSNSSTAPIYGSEKCKVILTLEPGTENVISDGAAYQYETEGEDEPDAPIFIKGDLTVNGTGSLRVQGNYQSGIRSKGNLVIVSGELSIDAQDDGLKGKDSVVIRDGVLDIRSVKDGIKSNNDSDETLGYIWIDGGQIDVAAQDDGIQAETALVINGGEITVTESQEGLAGKTVDILGGVIKAKTSDDGINSAASVETEQEKMQDQEGVYTRIAGGEVWLDAAADGIDSNGDLYIEGGTLYLSGPTSGGDGILDYNGSGTITGGTVFAAGSSGMMQTFGDDSGQNYLVVYYTETQKGGTGIRLLDASGNELGSFTPEKDYQAVIISSPDIVTGSTYRVETGADTAELTVNGVMTVYGTAPAGGQGRGAGGGRDRAAGRPGGEGMPPGEGQRPSDDKQRPAGERLDRGQADRQRAAAERRNCV